MDHFTLLLPMGQGTSSNMTLKQIPNSLFAPDGSQYATLTDGAGNLVTISGTAPTNVVTFTTLGANTYTPTAGMKAVQVFLLGGGGGGGGGARQAAAAAGTG